jgi:preprotein translocase subunit SecY
MTSFFNKIANIWKIEELKSKLIFTFILVLFYRLGSYIPLPAIDINEVGNILDVYSKNGTNQQGQGLLGLLSSFTGGAFSRASVLALGVMPYITASIVVQLMTLAIPYLQKLQNDGESGRKKISQITRWLTIIICLFQAPAYLASITQLFIPVTSFSSAYLVDPNDFWLFWLPSVFILVTGTVFTMWIGEKITDKGIGNGVSIIIMVGILANLPKSIINEFNIQTGSNAQGGPIFLLLEVVLWLAVVIFCILLTKAVRKIPVQYVKRAQVGSSSYMRSMSADAIRQYIPLKVNAAGVMPIIFAQAIMFLPSTLGSLFDDGSSMQITLASFNNVFGLYYNILFAVLIILFTFFYTAVTIPVKQMADDLKKNGGVIPTVKPGEETQFYLDEILSRITLPGAFLLAFLAILPAFIVLLGVTQGLALFFGGTSLLIMVGVILDTAQQIDTYLLNSHYDGLVERGRPSK